MNKVVFPVKKLESDPRRRKELGGKLLLAEIRKEQLERAEGRRRPRGGRRDEEQAMAVGPTVEEAPADGPPARPAEGPSCAGLNSIR